MLKNRSAYLFKTVLIKLTLLTLISCSTPSRPREEMQGVQQLPASEIKSVSEDVMGPPAPFGPLPETSTANGAPAYGPEPFQAKAIVLVLGPGLAKGFAHVGVLRALQEEKIPVAAIVATEMGALIGALYTQANSINSFEWAVQKFKPDVFQERSGVFFQKSEGLPKPLIAEIEKIFKSGKIEGLKKPTKILLSRNQSPFVVSDGNLSDAIKGALTGNGYYSPASNSATGTTMDRPYPVSEAQALGLGPVVVIDLLSGNAEAKDEVNAAFSRAKKNREKDLSEAALVIRPSLSNIGYLDFSKKSEAIFKGRSAIKENVKLLRPLAGLPAENLPEISDTEKPDESH